MRLVWTYSKDYKKGILNNYAEHEYIQWLFKKSITEAPSSYHKVIYTDEDTAHLFSDIVDTVLIRERKEFIFLADLKFDVAEILTGEFLITDGDLFIESELKIPDCDMAFEHINTVNKTVSNYKQILLEEGIVDYAPIWQTQNESSSNLGLMYFNNDTAKEELIKEYRKTQKFYINKIEPKYEFNKKNKQFSACGSQMLVQQFSLNSDYNVAYLTADNEHRYKHYNSRKKMDFNKEFYNKLI